MKKEDFVKRINKLKEQFDYDNEASKAFGVILKNDFVSGYDNSKIIDEYISLLSENIGDTSKWIEYYVYEVEFGKKDYEGRIKIDNENIRLSTPEDLYDLIKNK